MAKAVQIHGPDQKGVAQIDETTQALKVFLVNGSSGGGPTADVNIASVGGNAISGSELPVSDGGGSLTVDGTVAATQSGSWAVDADLRIGGTDVDAANPVPIEPGTGAVFSVDDNGGSLTVDGTVAATQSGSWAVDADLRIGGTDVDAANPVPIEPGTGAVFSVDDNGGSLTVDGTVAATQSGSWAVDADLRIGGTDVDAANPVPIEPGTGAVFSVDDNGGSLTVDGTVAATQSGSWAVDADLRIGGTDVDAANPVPIEPGTGAIFSVDDNGGSLTVDGTVAATQSGTWNINAISTAVAVTDNGGSLTVDGTVNAIVRNAGGPINSGNPLPVSVTNKLEVDILNQPTVTIGTYEPGTDIDDLGKGDNLPHTNGSTGVMMLGVRNEPLSTLSATNGTYSPIATDRSGRIYVRDSVTTLALSGSTRGRPIQITATSSTGNTLHTATTTSGQVDRVFIFLTNTSSSAVTVTLEFGTTGGGSEVDVVVPPNETIVAVSGAVIGGGSTDTITAYASTGSVVNAFGRVERLV
jgi:hypothetical protein